MVRHWKRLDRRTRRQVVAAMAVTGLVAVALALAARLHEPTARLLTDAAALTLGVVVTPVFFETTLGIVGLSIVFFAGLLRSRLEGDGWVELPVEEGGGDGEAVTAATSGSPEETAAGTGTGPGDREGSLDRATGRGGNFPASADLPLGVAEGYLELGMLDEAWDALMRVPRREWDTAPVARLRLRIAAANSRWREAEAAIEVLDSTGSDAEFIARHQLAQAVRLLESGTESGEVGSTLEARRSAARLVEAAAGRWPEAAALAAADPALGSLV